MIYDDEKSTFVTRESIVENKVTLRIKVVVIFAYIVVIFQVTRESIVENRVSLRIKVVVRIYGSDLRGDKRIYSRN